MKKILTILFFFGAIVFGAVFLTKSNAVQLTTPTSGVVAKPQITAASPPVSTSQGILPSTLVIPSLHITTEVEYVGMNEKGNMDVPKKDTNVAWFEPGYKPGENGNAVIAGHYDTKTGAPAVFYDLDQLGPGDTLILTAKDGSEKKFTVTEKKIYPYDAFPLTQVFGPSSKPRLNLITCEGTYSKTSHNYSHRTVIYSELEN